MTKKFYITSAIAYPNSSAHLGHCLEIVQVDAIARFHRLKGKDVFFQTGTDEHGNKNWQTAKDEGKEILEFLDGNVKVFKDLYKKLNISYDQFIRTSDKKVHYKGASKLWKELVKTGDLYKKKYKGLYCTGCEAFKTSKELKDGKCENHPTREVEEVEEENYFFKLSKYKDKISKLIDSNKYNIIPKVRKNEILSFLKEAKDISFSRPKSSLEWGIPVPDDESQVMYVWCDALSNYITGVGYGSSEFNNYWPADIHMIGKDILRFHAAFWPAMLLSAGIELPKELFVHGFILSKGAKMSKSTGNVIEPFEQIDKYGIDQFRFYLLGAMPIDGDGEYSEELLRERINNELVSNLCNFCYRIISFVNKNFEGEINKVDNQKEVIKEVEERVKNVEKSYYNFNFNEVLKDILHVSSIGNKYFQDSEPWKLIKTDKEKVHEIVGLGVNIAKILSIIISPIVPDIAKNIQEQLNVKNLGWKDIDFHLENHKLGKEKILIHKIEEDKVEEDVKDKCPLDLVVAKVIEVKDHPDADKLVVMKIDLGGEDRQLVAGIKDNYSLHDLQDKKIILVKNLEPAKLRGVMSQGMLLAGDSEDEVGLLTVEKSEVGDKVYFEGLENSSDKISFKNFQKLKIVVKGSKIMFKGKHLVTDKEDVKVEKVGDGARVR